MTDQPKRRGRPPKVRLDMVAHVPPRPDTRDKILVMDWPTPEAIAARLAPTADEAHVDAMTATDAWPAGSAKAWADDPWSAVRQMGDPYPLGRYRFKSGTLQQAWQHNNGVQWRPLPSVPADTPDWEDA